MQQFQTASEMKEAILNFKKPQSMLVSSGIPENTPNHLETLINDFIKTTLKEITFNHVHISERQQENSRYAILVVKKLKILSYSCSATQR